jgi:RNA polymerase sigma factor (sigma-70 family)
MKPYFPPPFFIPRFLKGENLLNQHSGDGSPDHAAQPSAREQRADFLAFFGDATKVILGFARQMGLSPEKAEVILQIVWLRFIEKGPVFTGARTSAQCHAWLLRVARNEVVNFFRASGRQPEQLPDDPRGEPLAHGEDDPATHEIRLRRSELFRRWLEELRQEHPLRHDLVFARHIEGAGPAELAEKYGKSAHWVSVQINRAVTDFRAWLLLHPVEDEEDRDSSRRPGE